MLKGKEFGAAIGKAIARKLENGSAKSKAEIARHFSMAPPSLSDWVKKGAVSKDKMPEFFRYFSDVADYSHWGMTKAEWPAGLTRPSFATAANLVESPPSEKPYDATPISEALRLMKSVDRETQFQMLGSIKMLESEYRIKAQNSKKRVG